MTKKEGLFESLPRVAAAAQPCPGLPSAALTALKDGGKECFLQSNILLLFRIGADYFIKMNETELLEAFKKQRSEEAFAELVRRYAGLVYSVAKRRLANVPLAEDVTQIVFIRFAKTPPNVRTHGELAAWLHRTTLNVAIDVWRSETRRRNREQQAVVMEPATHSAWDDISPNLDEAVNQLSDEDRQAVLLRFFGKKTMREVGTALGVSEAAAKMRVSRAVERLRTRLGVGGAVCTAAALGALLLEHSVEAAPLQLVSRLAAMRLPKLAGAATGGGLLLALLRLSKFKLVVGGAVVAIIGMVTAHLVRSLNPPVSVAASQESTDPSAEANANGSAPEGMNSLDSSVVPALRPPKILLHVLDAETGFGLPQARIHFVYFGAGGQEEIHDTLADENGDAPLARPNDSTKDSSPNVFVAAEGHVPKLVSPATNDYTVRLDAGMAVSGFVVDERDNPLPGVAIYVETASSKQPENFVFQAFPVTNHEDGSWTCSYIPKEDYTDQIPLLLEKTGYGATYRSIPWPKINSSNVILVMNSGETVTGRITDQQDHPIANARIKVLARDLVRRQSTYTDRDGVFTLSEMTDEWTSKTQRLETNATGQLTIRGLDPAKSLKRPVILPGMEDVNIVVQADGFAPEMKTIQLTNASHIVNFTLAAGNIFRGRVVDDVGNPISNVVVQTDYGGVERKFDWIAHTDANGMYQWDSAPAGETAYWIEADGYEVIRETFIADGGDHEVVLRRL